jgi:hypothetical protein
MALRIRVISVITTEVATEGLAIEGNYSGVQCQLTPLFRRFTGKY